MRKPLNTDHPGYDAECMVDLTADDLARLDAMAACQIDGREPRPQHAALVMWSKIGLACLILLAGLALMGDNSEVHDPAPVHRIASDPEWVDAQMVARLEGRR